jgi:hypothetical protein
MQMFFIPIFLSNTPSLFTKISFSNFDWKRLFLSSPVIHTVLLVMFLVSIVLFVLITLRLNKSIKIPKGFLLQIREHLFEKQFEQALSLCSKESTLASTLFACSIASKQHGPKVMIEVIQAEGLRLISLVQKQIEALKSIALSSVLIGTLGTLLSLFYAFGEVQRIQIHLHSLLNNLGASSISISLGLLVSITSSSLFFIAKYQMKDSMKKVKEEVLNLGCVIEPELSSIEA